MSRDTKKRETSLEEIENRRPKKIKLINGRKIIIFAEFYPKNTKVFILKHCIPSVGLSNPFFSL